MSQPCERLEPRTLLAGAPTPSNAIDLTFAGRYRFSVMADLFNIMNSNAVTNFNLLNGAQYDRIIATMDPRTFMLGLRFDF